VEATVAVATVGKGDYPEGSVLQLMPNEVMSAINMITPDALQVSTTCSLSWHALRLVQSMTSHWSPRRSPAALSFGARLGSGAQIGAQKQEIGAP
jgi:hypothetical protein